MAPPNIFGGQYIKEQSICLLIIVVCYNSAGCRHGNQPGPFDESTTREFAIAHNTPPHRILEPAKIDDP
jgi:hypothetical protein